MKCNGRFTGDNVSYIYPDFETVLRGKFVDDVMVEAAEANVTGSVIENGILRLEISEPRGPTFQFWPSTRTEVTCPHLQEDPFEKKVIVAASSSTEGSSFASMTQISGSQLNKIKMASERVQISIGGRFGDIPIRRLD